MKNKNNILIIFTVTLSALAVIAVVLITGFAKSGNGDESVVSVPTSISDDIPIIDISEPTPDENDTESSGANSGEAAAGDGIGQKVAASASALIGVPFAENGASPNGFDNSGFIYYVLRENGYITCPRTTDEQSRMGAKITRDDLKPGDLVFFAYDGSGEANFGGIYIGNGAMIACLNPETNVCRVDITTEYYTENFCGGISLS